MNQQIGRRTISAGLLLAGFTWGSVWPRAGIAATTPVSGPHLLLAKATDASVDPAAYLVSEKYDGVRAFWDGHRLRFRSGRVVPAPQWFLQRLPAQPLDGELWLARRQFDALSAIVRSKTPADAAWRQVRYMIFELPGAPGNFAERAAQIERTVRATAWPQLQAVSQQRPASQAALQRLLDKTVTSGGEGLMLHLASAPYITGRSEVLLKLKPQLDSEAVVIAHRPGQGKYAGMLGALFLHAADGRQFWVGSGFSDAQRRDPPAIGSTVTYRYRDLTSTGLPRFASFVRQHDGL